MSMNENMAACQPFPLDMNIEESAVKHASSRDLSEQDFNRIYSQYAPMVHGVLLARLPYDEVQDVMQEVFLAAFRSFHSLRDREAAGAWLFTVARHHAANFYRSSKKADELSETIESRPSKSSEAAEVLQMIKSMPDAYRETLVLRLVEGMTGDEISKQTGLKPESVRVNLHRGMKLLRDRLGIKV